ncbi:hypothetical protein CHS0354_022811 [Potamilus streckersoni]|uniref:BZIP domain-containing protein n=1 Tax=Potamilus streckersoni TaxID=2493646 RepID=A0AAE0S212_9BIVA|nr:hypothetical protein CHS0354_022811 [Potamilus streckersoni]
MYERSNSLVNVTLYMDGEIDSEALAASALPLILDELPVFTGFSTIDQGVSAAAMTAIESNDMMPIIKEELKNKIQFKRMTEGKEELTIDFTKKPKAELTDVEKEKVERRRVQNRMAARRFREKEKTLETKLRKVSHFCQIEN